jgi:hypothetical protein
MKTALSWLAIGVVVGVAATLITRPSALDRATKQGAATLPALPAIPTVSDDSILATRLAEVETELENLTEEMRVLREELLLRLLTVGPASWRGSEGVQPRPPAE